MTFYEEPAHYEKTVISDLQGAWENLRRTVVENHPFPESERLLFHVDEGMSWESVRDLSQMRKTLLLIQNLCNVNSVPKEVTEWVEEVLNILKEIIEGDAS
ncbi:MAG: hypothetical protein NTY51_08915 [Deltaproteobacteria bacterium]|nr:hypothetical protein [Deltaproteobacteria bacterium]